MSDAGHKDIVRAFETRSDKLVEQQQLKLSKQNLEKSNFYLWFILTL